MSTITTIPSGVFVVDSNPAVNNNFRVYGLRLGQPRFMGFRDSTGTLVAWGGGMWNSTNFLYYSDDEGETWSAGTGPNTSTATIADSSPNSAVAVWIDPSNDRVFVAGGDSSDDVNIAAFVWNPTTHTMSLESSGVVDSGLGVSYANLWGEYDGTDYWFWVSVNDDNNYRMRTMFYDVSLTGWNNPGFYNPDGVPADSQPATIIGTDLALTDEFRHIRDHTTDTMYAAYRVNGVSEFRISQGDWNSTIIAKTGVDHTVTDTSRTAFNVIASGYDPIEDRWWMMMADGGSTFNCLVVKSDTADPHAAWSEISTYAVDDGTVTFAQGNDDLYGYQDMLYRPDARKFVGVVVDDGGGTDWDYYYLEFDIVTETWTSTPLGFVHSEFYTALASDKFGSAFFWPWRGDTNEYETFQGIGFQFEHSANEDTHVMAYFPTVAGETSFAGWGIPMGIA